jgi:hypothetical protein
MRAQCHECGMFVSARQAYEHNGEIYCVMHLPKTEIPFSEKINLMYNFLYFYHMDNANACIHMQPVKYSPITFMLAEKCIQENVSTDGAAIQVSMHKGQYEMDIGR